MPQAKKRAARPRSTRSRSSATAVATHTISSTKLALSTLFLGFASLAAAAASSTPMSATDAQRIAQRLAEKNGVVTSTPAVTSSTLPYSSRAVLKFRHTKDAYTKLDRIVSAASPYQYAAEWEVTAMEHPVSLRKISFAIKSYGGPANITDFGVIKLGISGTKPGAEVSGVVIPNSNIITFVLPQPVQIPAFGTTPSSTGKLYLNASINDSGVLSPTAIRAFEFAPDTAANIEALDLVSGEIIPPEKILIGTDNPAQPDLPLTNGAMLMHDVFPTVSVGYPGGGTNKLPLNVSSTIFKFTVSAQGKRDLTLEDFNFNVKVMGLAAGNSSTGTISNFRLHEATATGMPGQLIGKAYPLCLAGGKAAFTEAGVPCRYAAEDTLHFSGVQAKNSPVIVPAGNSRTFIVVADTSQVLAGKTNGSVTVAVSIQGESGLKPGNNAYEKNWADGGLIYSYTPLNNPKAGPFSAADYPFNGFPLTATL